MHLKEKKSFPVFDEGQPCGHGGNAGNENNWKEDSAALWHELIFQVSNHWRFQFPIMMTILKESTSPREDPAEYYI